MVSEFGKELRRLRLDKGVLLKDMAEAAGISSSYLSAIETGKRDIPDDLITKISVRYNLTEVQCRALEAKAVQARNMARIKRNPHDDGTCLVALREKFHTLDADQVKAIQKIIA